jgi:hypothetical protein
MGFVHGTQLSYKDEDGQLVTRLDGYNSYLIVVDRATYYTWVFLTRNKKTKVETKRNSWKHMAANIPPRNTSEQTKVVNSGDLMLFNK